MAAFCDIYLLGGSRPKDAPESTVGVFDSTFIFCLFGARRGTPAAAVAGGRAVAAAFNPPRHRAGPAEGAWGTGAAAAMGSNTRLLSAGVKKGGG